MELQAMPPVPWSDGDLPIGALELLGLPTDDVAGIGEDGFYQRFQV